MDLSNFDFDLPKRLVALRPKKPRSKAKLLLYCKEVIKDYSFFDLPDLLNEKDLLIFNNTKVLPALLFGYVNDNSNYQKRKFELLLINQIEDEIWFCICKPLKKINCGSCISFSDKLHAKVLKKCEKGLVSIYGMAEKIPNRNVICGIVEQYLDLTTKL